MMCRARIQLSRHSTMVHVAGIKTLVVNGVGEV